MDGVYTLLGMALDASRIGGDVSPLSVVLVLMVLEAGRRTIYRFVDSW